MCVYSLGVREQYVTKRVLNRINKCVVALGKEWLYVK
jgi:hypothetical protein